VFIKSHFLTDRKADERNICYHSVTAASSGHHPLQQNWACTETIRHQSRRSLQTNLEIQSPYHGAYQTSRAAGGRLLNRRTASAMYYSLVWNAEEA